MAIYTLSDPHLSFGTDKPMDIFGGWSDYTDRIKSSWTKLVSPGDTVVIPGDISWAMDINGAKEDFAFLNALPGKKIIGKGNHDYWWCTMKKMREFISANGFDTIEFLFNNAFLCDGISVCGSRGWFFDAAGSDSEENRKVILREAGRLRTSIKEGIALGGEPVVFMHYPVAADGCVCEELFSVLKEFEIRRCYFGHIHSDRTGRYNNFEYGGIKFSLVSADNLSFCPKKVIVD